MAHEIYCQEFQELFQGLDFEDCTKLPIQRKNYYVFLSELFL